MSNNAHDKSHPRNLFPKLYLHSFMQTSQIKEPLIYSGLVKEHNFKGLITDMATILEYGLNDEHVICSINHPYSMLPYELILDIVSSDYMLTEELDKIQTLMLGFDKFDLGNKRLSNMRGFLTQVTSLTKKKLLFSIDFDHIKKYDDMSTILSMLRPYKSITPVIFGNIDFERTNWLIKQSLFENVSFFSHNLYNSQQLVNILDEGGFNSLMISGKSAIKLIQND